MRLLLVGHDRKSAVEQIMLTLFPNEHPQYIEDISELGDYGARVSLNEGKRYITAVTIFIEESKRFMGVARVLISSFGSGELERKRAQNNIIKRSFYKAVMETGKFNPSWGMLTGIRPSKITTAMLEAGATKEKAQRELIKNYGVSPERSRLCVSVSEAGVKVKNKVRPEDISVYVGIPFCPSRCTYCSFISNSVEKSNKLIEPYLDALEKEMEAAGKLVHDLGLKIKTVYFGGGTPTTLSVSQLERLMKRLRSTFDLSELEEYTVEAGRPDTVDEEKLYVLHENGADRVSINPQTMVDKVLEAVGRRHSAADVERAYNQARQVGFKNINMDLIAGLPSDDVAGFQYSLDSVIALQPENITVHTLARKKGSNISIRIADIPKEAEVSEMLEYELKQLERAGYLPYYLYRQKFMAGSFENVGWCKPKCECKYNIYIMEELHTILSLGAGGSTKLVDPNTTRIERIFNPKYPYEYIGNLEKVINTKSYMTNYYSMMKGK